MQLPLNVGDEFQLDVEGLSHRGEGVGRFQGYVVFVPGAVPGDRVEVSLVSAKKQYGRGLLTQLIRPSADRIAPPCPVAGQCGGCQLQHLAYEEQLRHKERQVTEAFARIGKMGVQVLPIIGMAEPWHFRNKGQFPVAGGSEGPLVGLYAPRSHDVVTFKQCLIQPPVINDALSVIKDEIRRCRLIPYDEKTHSGDLRHVVIRTNRAQDQLMVIVVTRLPQFQGSQCFFADLKHHLPNLRVAAWNINRERTNAVFGRETRIISGDSYIEETLGDMSFRISPRSFFQTNVEQTEVLYEEVKKRAAAGPEDVIWDLHCGTGTIGLYAGRDAAGVVGVDTIPEAVADAVKNARHNGINARYTVGRAEAVLKKAAADGVKISTAIVDPPRSGCEPLLLESLAQCRTKKIVYVSCNPVTLARDAAILEDLGYALGPVQPVDMFPHAMHLECVVVLSR